MTEKNKGERREVQRIRVEADVAGMRLDRFIREQLPGVPMGAIQRFLRTGQVRVNGGRVKGHRRLETGEEVRLPPVHLEPLPDTRPRGLPKGVLQKLEAGIIYRDPHLLVLNKPAGLPVHGGSGQPWGVVDGLREIFANESGAGQPELVHRLDKGTSGCLLFGLDRPTVRALAESFREGRIKKEYLTLIRGHLKPGQGRIDLNLVKGVTRSGERMVVAGEEGSSAQTRYRVVKRFADSSLVAVGLDTGRTHQIRVHFQWLKHPLAGDSKYGDRDFNRSLRELGLKRIFLHAGRLSFTHPILKTSIQVEAPLDAPLQKVLEALSNRENSCSISGNCDMPVRKNRSGSRRKRS
ncbi:MAG: RluA family pseudouridine synthase [Magnetococcales bacterium]|nr:RluA family pseudouridine synthase [Magnetococcales bacterium]